MALVQLELMITGIVDDNCCPSCIPDDNWYHLDYPFDVQMITDGTITIDWCPFCVTCIELCPFDVYMFAGSVV